MNYSEKLKDTRWKDKRLLIIERDDFKCRCCGEEDELQVHHTLYKTGKEPWDYEDNELITLCKECHLDAEHRLLKIKHLLTLIQQTEIRKLDFIRVYLERELTPEQYFDYKKIRFKHE